MRAAQIPEPKSGAHDPLQIVSYVVTKVCSSVQIQPVDATH
jgi:hypothetical protein